MTKSALSRSVLLWVGGLFLALAAIPAAYAQGTAEQREACTEDAIRLCPDAIPDVAKTTACMKVHEAQLSRRCHRVFTAEEDGPSPGAARRAEGDPTGGLDRPRRRSAPRVEEVDPVPRRAERQPPGPDDGYEAPPRAERGGPGPDDDYYGPPRRAERFRYGPDDPDDGPRRVERPPLGPDEDGYVPRRAEGPPLGPPDDGDGYGPRRYLYLSPRGPAEAPDDPY